eukprot:CAMPEP_0113503366 /NCGR_PEP_ID=MMETSP0014_2-20120614/34104_1 /TAXON_ID=2857 /ORGANISM="Nitzschia sp." /LENGTH=911 /DNA_ID=CAMNT_0000398325 /DNA_START=141 /DNA_END=2876 /DNA_ORIENTATION=+ /assembly_acc=CAM_ASM_000159
MDGPVAEDSPYLAAKKVAVVVDPYSTGCLVAQAIQQRGNLIIALWTTGFAEHMKSHVPVACGRMDYYAEVDQQPTFEDTKKLLEEVAHGHEIFCVFAGGEAGVDYADALSEYLGVLSNGTDIPNRRDKYVQQELIKEIGLRSVRQAGSDKFDDVESFLKTEKYPVVLKPTESAGSDGVKLCTDFEDAKAHFNKLMSSQMVNGGGCPSVLCQEFLQGDEYVIDHVSLNGVHKTVMIWVYDKRKANGGDFVYFGMKPVDCGSELAQILIAYIRRTLDALGIKHGPSHGEVMMTAEGPCLVEMNCRAHGGDGSWAPLARALTGGYSQVDVSADSFCNPKAFDKIPDRPASPFKASGQNVMFVSYSKGKVAAAPGYDIIKLLPSFVHIDGMIKVGAEVDYTTDLVTAIGSAVVMHEDPEIVERDLGFIRLLEQINGFFVYEKKAENLIKPADKINHKRVFSSDGPNLIRIMSNDRPELRGGGLIKRMTTVDSSKEVVVVVDPVSTGTVIADEVAKRGFSLICLWSKAISPELKTRVPFTCGKPNYMAEMDADDELMKTSEAVYKAAGTKKIVACFSGGDTGVELADALSELMKVRTNGTKIANRRDKKIQQEVIRKHGLRSMRQASGSSLSDVQSFLEAESYPVVVKPVEIQTSFGVKMCSSYDEAKDYAEALSKNGLTILCQEYLRGEEFIVDHVSRDGAHKTCMIYKYDKRAHNGAPVVYFGVKPVDSDSQEARILTPYCRGVLDALGIKNGATHAEIMLTPDGPCLVAMNVRANGGDGNWRSLASALTGGYSQVDVAVDAYLDKAKFSTIPDIYPSPFNAAGQEVYLVSNGRGIVKDTPGFEVLQDLPSFVSLETGVRKGSSVDFTVDLFSALGCVVLMHPDASVVDADIKKIRDMEHNNEFVTFEPHSRLK